MKLVGSRSNNTFDEFSDWDYVVESRSDFDLMKHEISKAVCFRVFRKGSLWILTVVMPDLSMLDFSDPTAVYADEWLNLESQQEKVNFADYWILSAKSLKAVYRGYALLMDVGIDYSLQLLRDIYIEQRLGVRDYKDFYSYKAIIQKDNGELENLFAVTGMPSFSLSERIEKLCAMNTMMCALDPVYAQAIKNRINEKLQQLKEYRHPGAVETC